MIFNISGRLLDPPQNHVAQSCHLIARLSNWYEGYGVVGQTDVDLGGDLSLELVKELLPKFV